MDVTQELQVGDLISGRYEILGCIGKGGMGIVYRVKQILVNKEFALKTIVKSALSDKVARRFQQEARTAFALDHPSIIAVNDFGLLEDQYPFLVMELIRGETLADRLKRLGCLEVDDVISIFTQCCLGLAYAHDLGIVHRDVKPSNIMILFGMPLGSEGSIKILDFGIAKFVEHNTNEIQALTKTGEIFGSPLYMSPEQCAGANVDHRSDVYALGCVLFEALSGTPPFIGDSALTTMLKHQNEAAPTLQEASLGKAFPVALEQIINKLLAKNPNDRYQNLGLVAHDLAALRRGESPSRTPHMVLKAGAGTENYTINAFKFKLLIASIVLVTAVLSALSGYWLRGASDVQPQASVLTTVNNSPLELQHQPNLDADIPLSSLKEELKKMGPEGRFHLHESSLNRDSLSVIAQFPVKDLDLVGCSISNDDLDCLNTDNLRILDLSDTTLNDIGASKLKEFDNLLILKVSRTHLTDGGFKELSQMQSLKSLVAVACLLSDQGLEALGKSKTLDLLDVGETRTITNNGIATLSHAKISWLGLDRTNVTDSALAYLGKMHNLRTVILNKTHITPNGILRLCQNENIKIVDIKDCLGITEVDLIGLRSRFPKVTFDRTN